MRKKSAEDIQKSTVNTENSRLETKLDIEIFAVRIIDIIHTVLEKNIQNRFQKRKKNVAETITTIMGTTSPIGKLTW